MANVIWTELALEDLKSIHDFIAQDSSYYAHRFTAKIVKRVKILERHPKIGKKVPEFDDEYIRELLEGNYRIIYRIQSRDQIGIARVHHSARLLKNL